MDEEIIFLLASHAEDGYRAYQGVIDGVRQEVVIPPGVEVAVHEGWLHEPTFARDMQHAEAEDAVLTIRRSAVIPLPVRPDVDEVYNLSDTLAHIARRVCYENELDAQVKQALEVHTLLGPGGMTPNGVRVNKRYCKDTHVPFLRAIIDLETRYRNRPKMLKYLRGVIGEIEAL